MILCNYCYFFIKALRDFDEEFRENHIEIIKRFYLIFESIHSYISDLNHYLDELQDGMFIHQSIETVFADMEGRQLLVNSLFNTNIYTKITFETK